MNRLTKIGAVAAGSVALLAGTGYALGADNGSPTSGQAGSSQSQATRPAPPKFDPQQASKDRDEFYSKLGEKLGKSKDEVKAAFRSLLSDHLDQDVKAGRLTNDQKDAILQGFDAGLPGPGMIGIGPGPGGPHGGPGGPGGPGGGPPPPGGSTPGQQAPQGQ